MLPGLQTLGSTAVMASRAFTVLQPMPIGAVGLGSVLGHGGTFPTPVARITVLAVSVTPFSLAVLVAVSHLLVPCFGPTPG